MIHEKTIEPRCTYMLLLKKYIFFNSNNNNCGERQHGNKKIWSTFYGLQFSFVHKPLPITIRGLNVNLSRKLTLLKKKWIPRYLLDNISKRKITILSTWVKLLSNIKIYFTENHIQNTNLSLTKNEFQNVRWSKANDESYVRFFYMNVTCEL